jgi:hypothetical protein
MREVIAFLKAKLGSLLHKHLVAVAEENPLALPWPPGKPTRIVHHPTLGWLIQLRNGERLPPRVWDRLRRHAAMVHGGEFSLN